jgi:hypothetical protein
VFEKEKKKKKRMLISLLQNHIKSPFKGFTMPLFRYCSIVAGCDFFKLPTIAMGKALKYFKQCIAAEAEEAAAAVLSSEVKAVLSEWLVELDPVLLGVFCTLASSLKWDVKTAGEVVKQFLLADALFQCQLVANFQSLQAAEPPKTVFFHRIQLDKLSRKQQQLVKEKLDYVFGQRWDADTELLIAKGKASAVTGKLFSDVRLFSLLSSIH